MKKVIPEGVNYNPELPYSPLIKVGDFYFSSGILPAIKDKSPVSEFFAIQFSEMLRTVEKLLQDSGLSFDDIVRVDLKLADLNDYQTANEIYRITLKNGGCQIMPVRLCDKSAGLPFGAKCEMIFIAVKQS